MMKLFVRLSAAVSVTVLLAACSSSSSPSDDAGVTDASADATTTDSAGACTAITPASAPTFTAPAIGQGVCGSADISAFAGACGVATPGSPLPAGCQTWLQSSSTAACRQCLLGSNNTIGPLDSVMIAGQAATVPSLGACILGTSGSATPAGCPAAAEPLVYCADAACAQCTGAAAETCIKSTTSGVCSQYVTPLTKACSGVIAMLAGCETSLGTTAELTEAATVICGSAGPSGDGGGGEGGSGDGGGADGAVDSGSSDAGSSDGEVSDGATVDSALLDSSLTDSSLLDGPVGEAGGG